MTATLAGIFRRNRSYEVVQPIGFRMGPSLFFPIVLLVSTFALAADVSGRWNGSMDFKDEEGQVQTVPAHVDLRQKSDVLVGTVWKEDGQRFQIEQGRVNGNEISFTFKAPEVEEDQILVHSVKLSSVSPTQMQGTLEFDAGGQKFVGKLSFTREK